MVPALSQARTSPFDRLPSELLLDVFAHLPPPVISIGEGVPASQHNTLFDLQLVYKRFHQLCTTLLWRDLEVDVMPDTRRRLQQAVDRFRASPARAEGCRTLRLEALDWTFMPLDLIGGPGVFPNVERLELFQAMPLSLDVVARLPRLRHLVLQYGELRPARHSLVFPHLVSLHLSDVTLAAAPKGWKSISLSKSVTPALRRLCLGLVHVEDSSVGVETGRAAVFSQELVEQLEQVSVGLEHGHLLCGRVLPVGSVRPDLPILWHASLDLALPPGQAGQPLSPVPITFLCVRPLASRAVADPSFVLKQLGALVARHLYLRLLLLPAELWSSLAGPPNSPTSSVARLFLKGCSKRGLEVKSYDPLRPLEGFVPPEFSAFLKEHAASRAV